MKHTIKALLFVILLVNLACKTKPGTKNTIQSQTSTAVDSSVQVPADKKESSQTIINRLVISFFSAGEGAEYEYIRKFEDSIGEFSAEKGKNIDYEKSAWGREGETEFCLLLREITTEEQSEFINRTRELLKTAKFVHVYENQACRHPHRH